MTLRRIELLIALVIIVALSISACAPAAPAPTPGKSEAAPTKASEPTKPAVEATKPAVEATKPAAVTKAPEAAKPASEASKPEGPLPQTINLATMSPGSAFNAIGTGLAKVASDVGPIRTIVQPFAGPTAWIPQMVSNGKPEVGVMQLPEAWQAFTGKAMAGPTPPGITVPRPYEQAWDGLRLLLIGTNMNSGLLVRRDSKYQTQADLKGARVSWGFKAGPGCILTTLSNLALGGLTINDVQTVDVPAAADAVRALGEGRLDAACAATGMGVLSEVDAQVGVRFLDTPRNPNFIKVAQSIQPGGDIAIVKGGSTAGVPKDTGIWSYPTAVVVSTKMPDNVAYALVKIWWDNYQKLTPLHTSFQDWKPDLYVSKTATIPYHSGAIAFYKEKGAWSAEMDQIQQQLLKGELPFLK